ncbi:hypothetical protein [Nocardia farcinica]|nr:hypothetical protein [Nocardia farcinica]AXK88840.1 hypothetical protein DXT66_27310 [Nocardia farcinica]
MSTYTEGDLVIIDGRRWRVARISDDGRPSVRLVRMPTYTRIGTTVYADVLDRIGTRVPPTPELSREHLAVFAVDPHAAAESEVAAMAQELVAARARIAEMESERAAATAASLGGGVYSFAFDRARASVEHIVTTDAWRDKLSAADRASLVDQLDTAMRAGMEPAIANAVVAGSVLAGRARFAELEKRVAELEGELGPLRTQRSAAYAILASIAAELGAEEETRWECLPEMARALATRKINPDTVLWAPTEEGQADA